MRLRTALFATVAALGVSAPAAASDYLTGYVGWFDVIDEENEATQFGLEYRMSPIGYGLRPTIGIDVTTDGAVYAFGGINWEVPLIDNQLFLIPNFMAGGYSQGDGKDLGHGLEFRSGLELSYQMENTHRVGVAVNHISNASLGDKNPGAETILINYSVPVGSLF